MEGARLNLQRLEIFVTDAMREAAAEGMRVDLYCLGRRAAKLCSAKVGPRGALQDPVLESGTIRPGEYELVFHIAEFYRLCGVAVPEIPFLDTVPFRFGIPAEVQLCTLPVRVSPHSFAVEVLK
jgi:5-hydroxyisourate hydrolase